MPELSCTACQAHLPDFYTGELSGRLNRQVVKHLRQCDGCLHLAERQTTIQTVHNPVKPTALHTTKRSVPGKGQAVAKWGAVFFMLMIVGSLLCFAYDTMTQERREAHIRAWAELRYPQAKVGTQEIDWTGWLPYYRHERHYPLLWRDGSGGNRRLGTVVVSQVLWQHGVDVRLHQPETWPTIRIPTEREGAERRFDDQESGAEQRESGDDGEDVAGSSTAAAWTALNQLPASITVDMVFATRHFLTPRAMVAMLNRYNTQLLGMYVYGGETREEQGQMPPLALVLWSQQSGASELATSQHALVENLRTVVQYPVKAEERHIWQRRLHYLQENGFQSYGVVIRGIPRELLRLREVLELQEPIIIGIDWVYTAP